MKTVTLYGYRILSLNEPRPAWISLTPDPDKIPYLKRCAETVAAAYYRSSKGDPVLYKRVELGFVDALDVTDDPMLPLIRDGMMITISCGGRKIAQTSLQKIEKDGFVWLVPYRPMDANIRFKTRIIDWKKAEQLARERTQESTE